MKILKKGLLALLIMGAVTLGECLQYVAWLCVGAQVCTMRCNSCYGAGKPYMHTFQRLYTSMRCDGNAKHTYYQLLRL